ncbi:type I secretion system permease/ATPase [Azohydromonas lata]|uniref:Type I secretion system permease/ATPase n=1 Tax=Azohydromonas lata TaxID=45677 RepID=A0ABU5IN63_9BURK|nr:type I secretion system permease/ATPase [Azohydromonas lata]MDZ5460315.1 type I secretion system permease/ATPase [Azohydromonas lata]
MQASETPPPTSSTPVGEVLQRCKRSFWAIAVISVIVELMSLAPIVYMWNAFDRVLASRSVVTLVSLTTLVVGVYLFWSAMDHVRSRLLVRLSLRVDWELAAEVFDASFRRSVGRRALNVQQVMADLLELRQFLGGRGVIAMLSAPFALVFIIVGAVFHPFLAVFSLVSTAVMLIAALVNRRITTAAIKAASDANQQSMHLAGATLRQAEATLALGMMPALRRRWHRKHREFLTLQVNSSDAAGVGQGFTSFLQQSFASLGMALGLFLAIEGLITSGMVMAASMLISRAVSPLQQFIGNWPNYVRARQAMDRLNLLLAEDGQREQQMALPAPVGRLTVCGASATAPGTGKTVLSGVDFELEAGQVLALVGPSAAGKSTLAKLLVGVWKPAEGSVRLDGVEISDWNHDELGPRMGYVPQEVEFFEGSVAENIARLGDVDAGKVVAAAKLAGMHDTILGWPQGYDTLLGDGTGFALSGGQRQRLAIARALYGEPAYIVFDEPNANLDEAGEQSLINTVVTLRERGVTVVLSTHRPRVIGVADRMLVLKQGRQVGFGTPRDLFAAVGAKAAPPQGKVAAAAPAPGLPPAPASHPTGDAPARAATVTGDAA